MVSFTCHSFLFVSRWLLLALPLVLLLRVPEVGAEGGQTAVTLVDSKGYIVYCPCMGRFGNQAEQLLGSLQFAKHLNRTLVLPPFIEYVQFKVSFIPFQVYIEVGPIAEYHRVITMDQFMSQLAPKVWPPEERIIYCYSGREGPSKSGCNPFDGNPFKPFWHHIDVTTFKESHFHAPLVTQYVQSTEWIERYKDHKVLAFVGAPSSFPTNEEALLIQEYIHLTESVALKARAYREKRGFLRKAYLAVHLRHGVDWSKACSLLKENDMSQLFSSEQCTRNLPTERKGQPLPMEVCMPSIGTIIEQIEQGLRDPRNVHNISTVYVAADHDDPVLWAKIHERFPEVTLITPSTTYSLGSKSHHPPPHYMVDVYLLTFANYFIGNCVSSFSAFVSRLRTISLHLNQSTKFFGQQFLVDANHVPRDEL